MFLSRLSILSLRAIRVDDRVCNLTLACEPCNQAKGKQDILVFLAKKPELLSKIQAQAKAPRKDAAAVNATRWKLYHRLEALGLPVECGSGGLTKFNRTQRVYPKTHWLDACCVYQTGDMIRAVVKAGLKTEGTHIGRVLARATGSFDIVTKQGRIAGVGYRSCRPIHRNDGYSYQKGARHSSPA